MMRFISAMMSLPGLLLPLMLLAALGGGIGTVSLTLGISYAPPVARLMRVQAPRRWRAIMC